MTELKVAYIIPTGRKYLYQVTYAVVSPKVEDDYKSEDVTYATFTTRELAQQFILDVWGADEVGNFEIRESRLMVGFLEATR